MKKCLLMLGAAALLFVPTTPAKADGVLLAQCFEFTTCWTGSTPTSWSDTLSDAQLVSLETPGSNSLKMIVEENTEFIIRLGVTTADFTTTGGPVVETLGEFNGIGSFNDPCPTTLPYCETDVVGSFEVPANTLSATFSGTFGNSTVPNSAGSCVFLGSTGPCSLTAAVPEPGNLPFSGAGLVVLLEMVRRFRKRSAAAVSNQ